MRQYVGEADFDNFNGYRNMAVEDLLEFADPPYLHAQYISEAEVPSRPEPGKPKRDGNYTTESPSYSEGRRWLGPELGNPELPIHDFRHEIVQTVSQNKFTIITAETGAGKSTQVAQILYAAGYNVIQTHPRRIAAREVCLRQREELSRHYGKSLADQMVSFQTAAEQEGPLDAPIRNVTDGLELARELGEKQVPKETIIIVDEVHEGNCNMDFLMAWAKKQGAENDSIHFVFMSATMDAPRLSNYYAEEGKPRPPIVEVPGRNFEVKHIEEPESTVVDETVKAAIAISESKPGQDDPNAILVFQPGVGEINDTIKQIRKKLPSSVKEVTILPLYADLSPAKQKEALKRYQGVVIIVATNVAETSLTIPGVKYVIDSGMERRNELDDNGIGGLVIAPISKSQCRQRAGRAGRLSDGFYILTRQNKKAKVISYGDDERPEFPVPEILRTDIGRNVLRFAGAGYNLLTDLELFNPVKPRSIRRAQKFLHRLSALDKRGNITDIGLDMNRFPVGVEAARMLYGAQIHSETVQAATAAIAAASEVGGLIDMTPFAKKGWKKLTDETSSDMLAQLDLFIAARDMSTHELLKYGLSIKAMSEARLQYGRICKMLQVAPDDLKALNHEQRQIVRRLVLVAQSNNIYVHTGSGKYKHVSRVGDADREISSRSRLAKRRPEVVAGIPYRVEFEKRDGVIGAARVVERATSTTPQEIGRVLVHLTHWKSEGFVMRDGSFTERRRQFLGKFDLGIVEEVVPKPSARLRQVILEHIVEQPMQNQRRLLELKKEVEALARKSKAVTPFTQDFYLDLLERAAPNGTIDRWTVDNNLGQILITEGITLDRFAPRELRKSIAINSPDQWYLDDGIVLELDYSKGQPIAKHYDLEALLTSEQTSVALPDGREVRFAYQNGNGDTKTCNLFRLRQIYGVELVYS